MFTSRRQYVMLAVPLTMTALLASACSSDASSSDTSSSEAVATPYSASPDVSTTESVAAKGSNSSSLAGGSWQLTAFASSSGSATKATSSPSAGTLVFADQGKVSGSTGCNSFNGTYKQSGSSLTITVGPMTMMACSGAAATQETAVLANLAKVNSFTAGAKLQLKSGSSTLLTYKADATGLAGTSWVATGINNGKGGVVSDANTSKVTAKFNTEGGISGKGGCNTYSASFTTSGKDGLKIGPAVSTMMACDPASIMTTEQQYFAALTKVATYQRDGNRLTLRDASGATQVTYIPAS
jgi:heat shock protein HslJ